MWGWQTLLEVLMLAYAFVLVAISMRFAGALHLTPYAFMPVGASLLFFGARAPKRQMWIPLALLVATDVALSTLVYHYPLDSVLLASWAWYAGTILVGWWLRSGSRPLRLAGAAIAAPCAFFLVSNFAVWAAGGLYPKTFAGLMTCYLMGLPFFRNDVAGTLFFAAIFFSIPVLLERLKPVPAKVKTI